MNKVGVICLALAAGVLSPAVVGACEPSGGCCIEAQPCTVYKPVFHVEVTEQKCPKMQKVEYPYIAKSREIVRDVPCTRCVPVCVTDPCTGCTRTEYKEECFIEKVKVLVIDILPPEKDCEYKCVDKITKCATVTLDHTPVCAPPVCCPAPCCHP
jgi:hypothetical protein